MNGNDVNFKVDRNKATSIVFAARHHRSAPERNSVKILNYQTIGRDPKPSLVICWCIHVELLRCLLCSTTSELSSSRAIQPIQEAEVYSPTLSRIFLPYPCYKLTKANENHAAVHENLACCRCRSFCLKNILFIDRK